MATVLEELITRKEAELLVNREVEGILAEFRRENPDLYEHKREEIDAVPGDVRAALDKLFEGRETITVGEGLGVLNAKIDEKNAIDVGKEAGVLSIFLDSTKIDLAHREITADELAQVRQVTIDEKAIQNPEISVDEARAILDRKVQDINAERAKNGLDPIQTINLTEADVRDGGLQNKVQQIEAQAPTPQQVEEARRKEEKEKEEPNPLMQIMQMIMAVITFLGQILSPKKDDELPQELIAGLDKNHDAKVDRNDFDFDGDKKLTTEDKAKLEEQLQAHPELRKGAESLVANLNIEFGGEAVDIPAPSAGGAGRGPSGEAPQRK